MKNLLRSLAILILLLGVSILLPVQPRAHAEFLDCWEDFNLSVSDCVTQQTTCLNNGGSTEDCRNQYQLCLSWATDSKSNCEFIEGPEEQPWPVIDFFLTNCLSGCQGCNDLDPPESLACMSQCNQYCRDNYPKN